MHLANPNNRNYYHKKVLTLFLQSFGFQSWLTDMPHTIAVNYFVKQSAIYPKICWIHFNCCPSQYSPCLTWCRNQSFFLNISSHETHMRYAYRQTTMRYATQHRKEICHKSKLNSNCSWKCLWSSQCPKVNNFQVVKTGHNIRFRSNSWLYHPVLTFLEQGSEQVQIQVMPLP